MCPLVVESSISSSPLLLAVNDRRSQSHQLDSTSSTGNRAPLSPTSGHSASHTHYTCFYPPGSKWRSAHLTSNLCSKVDQHGCSLDKHTDLQTQKSAQHCSGFGTPPWFPEEIWTIALLHITIYKSYVSRLFTKPKNNKISECPFCHIRATVSSKLILVKEHLTWSCRLTKAIRGSKRIMLTLSY